MSVKAAPSPSPTKQLNHVDRSPVANRAISPLKPNQMAPLNIAYDTIAKINQLVGPKALCIENLKAVRIHPNGDKSTSIFLQFATPKIRDCFMKESIPGLHNITACFKAEKEQNLRIEKDSINRFYNQFSSAEMAEDTNQYVDVFVSDSKNLAKAEAALEEYFGEDFEEKRIK